MKFLKLILVHSLLLLATAQPRPSSVNSREPPIYPYTGVTRPSTTSTGKDVKIEHNICIGLHVYDDMMHPIKQNSENSIKIGEVYFKI